MAATAQIGIGLVSFAHPHQRHGPMRSPSARRLGWWRYGTRTRIALTGKPRDWVWRRTATWMTFWRGAMSTPYRSVRERPPCGSGPCRPWPPASMSSCRSRWRRRWPTPTGSWPPRTPAMRSSCRPTTCASMRWHVEVRRLLDGGAIARVHTVRRRHSHHFAIDAADREGVLGWMTDPALAGGGGAYGRGRPRPSCGSSGCSGCRGRSPPGRPKARRAWRWRTARTCCWTWADGCTGSLQTGWTEVAGGPTIEIYGDGGPILATGTDVATSRNPAPGAPPLQVYRSATGAWEFPEVELPASRATLPPNAFVDLPARGWGRHRSRLRRRGTPWRSPQPPTSRPAAAAPCRWPDRVDGSHRFGHSGCHGTKRRRNRLAADLRQRSIEHDQLRLRPGTPATADHHPAYHRGGAAKRGGQTSR